MVGPTAAHWQHGDRMYIHAKPMGLENAGDDSHRLPKAWFITEKAPSNATLVHIHPGLMRGDKNIDCFQAELL